MSSSFPRPCPEAAVERNVTRGIIRASFATLKDLLRVFVGEVEKEVEEAEEESMALVVVADADVDGNAGADADAS